jgi:hypothetical protein
VGIGLKNVVIVWVFAGVNEPEGELKSGYGARG